MMFENANRRLVETCPARELHAAERRTGRFTDTLQYGLARQRDTANTPSTSVWLLRCAARYQCARQRTVNIADMVAARGDNSHTLVKGEAHLDWRERDLTVRGHRFCHGDIHVRCDWLHAVAQIGIG